MKLQRPSATQGVALIAMLAAVVIAGLLTLACSGPNSPEPTLESVATSEALVLSSSKADDALLAEEHEARQSAEGLVSDPNKISPGEGGTSVVPVASPTSPMTVDTTVQATGRHHAPGDSASRQTGINLLKPAQAVILGKEPPSLLSETGDSSTTTPEQDNFVHPAIPPETPPAIPITVTSASSGYKDVPLEEAGKLAANEGGGTTDASGPNQQFEGNDNNVPALKVPAKKLQKYPNLSSNLNQVVADFEAKRTNAGKSRESASIIGGKSVAVTIYLSGQVNQVLAFLEDNGGDPRNVGKDYIEAYVPVALLGPVAERPGVVRVAEIIPPQRGRALPNLTP